jgi:tetratricopeptide (TPR) repeat protein
LDRALQNAPNDAALHEFRALVLFAMGRYDKAAETLYGVLSVGPGWDWPTLRNLYDNVDTYTQQLRRLEAAKKQDPTNPALQFLLGYHYLTCGYPQQALAAFEQVLKVQPEDKVAQEMVKMLSSVGESPTTPTPPAPTTAAAPPLPPQELLPQEQVIGTWSAKGQDDMTYALTLREDNTFSWSFGKEGALQKIEGVYALDKNSLALEPQSGGSLLRSWQRIRVAVSPSLRRVPAERKSSTSVGQRTSLPRIERLAILCFRNFIFEWKISQLDTRIGICEIFHRIIVRTLTIDTHRLNSLLHTGGFP